MAIPPLSLVADVGGTNTRAALADGEAVRAGSVRRYRNADHASLEGVLAAFLRDSGAPDCDGACIAMAGPVLDGTGRLTNLDWTLRRTDLARVTRAETVSILNDLQAQGHALDHIAPAGLRPLVAGPEGDAQSAKLVIGIGTGFNAVPVFRTETGRYVPSCEAGHVTFPVLSDGDLSLARFVSTAHGFPGVEDVLSGRGLERVYAWASDGASRDGAAILRGAADRSDPAATRAVEVFVQAMGRVTGDLALTHLPFGGIYFIGGMARAVTPWLEPMGFARAMRAKGRFSGFMERFAVWSVEDDYAALTGCAHHVADLIGMKGALHVE